MVNKVIHYCWFGDKPFPKLGKKCLCIADGDTNEEYKITKDCIELYTPLEVLNNMFNINLNRIPETKEDFFKEPIVNRERSADTVKAKLSSKANIFLTQDNPLVDEIKIILEAFKLWYNFIYRSW